VLGTLTVSTYLPLPINFATVAGMSIDNNHLTPNGLQHTDW